jgi:hypothetical protein
MKRVKQALAVAIFGVILQGGVPPAAIGAPPACVPQWLRIIELGTIPELVQVENQIQVWTVRLKSDGDCLTVFDVRERDRIVGRSVPYLIKLGEFSYTVTADPNYRFRAQEHCLRVLVNVADAWVPVDAIDPQKVFCARYRPQPAPGGWSLK